MKDKLKLKVEKKLKAQEINGQWKFEAVYEDRVEPLTEFHNDPTELWGEYSRIMNKYQTESPSPVATGKLIPAAIGVYDDGTPVNLAAGAPPTGTLRGFIDLTSTNPDPADALEGFRLTSKLKEELIEPNVYKLTYQAEFPTSTAVGTSNRIRLCGAPEYLTWDSAQRTAANSNDYGIKKESLSGGAPLINPSSLYRYGGNSLPLTHILTYPAGYIGDIADDSGGWYQRYRAALRAISTDRWCMSPEVKSHVSAKQIYIMPIRTSKYLSVPLYGRGRIVSDPIKMINLPVVEENYSYYQASTFFNGLDLVVVTQNNTDILIHYYTEADGYSLTTHVLPAPKPAEYGTEPHVLVAGCKNGKLTIMQYVKSNESTPTVHNHTVYVTQVDMTTWAAEFLQSPIDTLAVMPTWRFETWTSYGQNVLDYIYYDYASEGFFVHGVDTNSTSTDLGWTWIAHKPVLNSWDDDFVAIGKNVGGEYYPYYTTQPEWYNRSKYARAGGNGRSASLVLSPNTANVYSTPLAIESVLPHPDEDNALVFNYASGYGHKVPLTLFKSSTLTDAVMGEIDKTEAFGLRVTYELTITEETI